MVARLGVKYALEPSPKTMGTFAVEIVSMCFGSASVANRAPRRGGAYEMSVSFCLSEPMETAQSIGDDTHAVVARLTGHQSTEFATLPAGRRRGRWGCCSVVV